MSKTSASIVTALHQPSSPLLLQSITSSNRSCTSHPCSLVDNIVNAGDGFYPASTEDFYAYVTDTFLPATLGSDGYIGNYNLMIGGIRLATTRSTPSQCSMITGAWKHRGRQAGLICS